MVHGIPENRWFPITRSLIIYLKHPETPSLSHFLLLSLTNTASHPPAMFHITANAVAGENAASASERALLKTPPLHLVDRVVLFVARPPPLTHGSWAVASGPCGEACKQRSATQKIDHTWKASKYDVETSKPYTS